MGTSVGQRTDIAVASDTVVTTGNDAGGDDGVDQCRRVRVSTGSVCRRGEGRFRVQETPEVG